MYSVAQKSVNYLLNFTLTDVVDVVTANQFNKYKGTMPFYIRTGINLYRHKVFD